MTTSNSVVKLPDAFSVLKKGKYLERYEQML